MSSHKFVSRTRLVGTTSGWPEMQCLLDALVGPSPSASTGDRYLVYGPPLGLHDQAVALRNALA
jgi:hypothetical protein